MRKNGREENEEINMGVDADLFMVDTSVCGRGAACKKICIGNLFSWWWWLFPGGDTNGFVTGYNGTLSAGATLGRFLGAGIDIS
ncbi:MAG: hypothetical protein ABSB79_04305 [Syntrophales bacterium]